MSAILMHPGRLVGITRGMAAEGESWGRAEAPMARERIAVDRIFGWVCSGSEGRLVSKDWILVQPWKHSLVYKY